MPSVDLNCDMGESWGAYTMGDDAAMLRIVTSANVACGFHGGDPLVMHKTLSMAKANGVNVGAHPSYLDSWGFGRRRLVGEDPADIEKMLVYQIGAICQMATYVGHRVAHVKPHGTLGNAAQEDDALAAMIAATVKAIDPRLILMVMPGGSLERAGEKAGLRIAREVFADRAYDDRGMLVSRKLPGAVIHDAALAARNVLRMVEERAVISVSGKRVPVAVDTICVHGDNPAAVAMASEVRRTLETSGVQVVPLDRIMT
ncbi:MAG: LamB/YcsF family protein [Alphaproteobacteria bacterium]|nr:LamB/YcsF family protein [Alphaproteobacteria bacterium]